MKNLHNQIDVLYKSLKTNNIKLSDKELSIINGSSTNSIETINNIDKLLKEIEPEVDQEMIKLGLLRVIDGKKTPVFGSVHTRWQIEKRLLKERYNIDWKTLEEENPNIMYD